MKNYLNYIKEKVTAIDIRTFIDVSKIDYDYHFKNNLQYHSLYNKLLDADSTEAINILIDGFLKDVENKIEFVDDRARLYRAIALEHIYKLNKDLGIYWAYSESGAVVYDDVGYVHETQPSENVIILRADFDIIDVDWQNTLDLYLMNEWFENEVEVVETSHPHNINYKDEGEKNWRILNN